jgi:hypothetical protein
MTTDLSTDEIHRILSSQTRRETINYFRQNPSKYHSREDIAEYLEGETEDNIEDITIKLHHNHLPMLEEVGFILYEPDRNKITYLGDERLEENIDAIE